MKIRITENQYSKLVKEQEFNIGKATLKKLGVSWDKLNNLISRLRNPTDEDFDFLTNLSPNQLKAVLKLVPGKDTVNLPDLYPIPLVGKVTKYINSCYGFRRATGTNRLHAGVDLDTTGLKSNQPLMAACSGVVVSATESGDCGGFIKIKCNSDYEVGYCHLRVVNDNLIGLKVPKGFPIGVSGGGKDENLSGNSMGPHLHYITWRGGKKVNPINVMDGGHTIPAGGKENKSGNFCNPNPPTKQ